MSWHDKVVWQEGMFLRAQHFQQQDRHTAHLLQARAAPLRPHPWGLTELSLDRDLLASGRFAFGIGGRRDGGRHAVLHSRQGRRRYRSSCRKNPKRDRLSRPPLYQDGRPEMTAPKARTRRARYGLRSFDAFDTHSDSTMPPSSGRATAARLLATEDLRGYSCLGLTRIVEVQADRKVVLDDRLSRPA